MFDRVLIKLSGESLRGERSYGIDAATVDGIAREIQAVADNGNFSLFTGVTTSTKRRRDRYMFPLNTDYDLFSLGPDHATATSLGESTGLDDVIRANNGGFFGLASNY